MFIEEKAASAGVNVVDVVKEYPVVHGFERRPAGTHSLAFRKTVWGAGRNDANYEVTQYENGKITAYCPAYRAWKGMIERCYSTASQAECPTYSCCSVCDSWLTFSNFQRWFDENYVAGYELDKDLKVEGNKIYSPSTCVFVPRWLNLLFTDRGATRGSSPIGVNWDKSRQKYRSQVGQDGHRKYLGLFDTPEVAHAHYLIAKCNVVLLAVRKPDCPRELILDLIQRAISMKRKGEKILAELE